MFTRYHYEPLIGLDPFDGRTREILLCRDVSKHHYPFDSMSESQIRRALIRILAVK